MKRLLFLLLALVGFNALAQFAIPDPTARPTANAPDDAMPPGQIYIDLASIPNPRFAFSTPRTKHPYDAAPAYSGDTVNTGAFRVPCRRSHFAFDDPIVHPGLAGSSHLHVFFGNTETRASRDLDNMAVDGNSTCQGGTLNRSGYWIPPLVYHCPDAASGCNTARHGEVQEPSGSTFYYKCAMAASCDDIQWAPPGFRMISGRSTNTELNWGGHAPLNRIECWAPGAAGSFDHIPSPAQATAADNGSSKLAGTPCTEINYLWGFPTCWDGVNTDSPGTHDTHVAHQDFYLGCTDPSYPVHIPEVAFNIQHTINYTDLPYLRLSSDKPETGDVLQSGSTTTTVVLSSSESSVDDYYNDGIVVIAGELRYITDYVGATRTATLASALTGAPTAGTAYRLRNAAGRTLHGDWVNGWSEDPDTFGVGVGSVTDVIIRNCYRKGHAVPSSKSHGDCHDSHLGNPSDVDDQTISNMWGLR